jgi:hypothetical protein
LLSPATRLTLCVEAMRNNCFNNFTATLWLLDKPSGNAQSGRCQHLVSFWYLPKINQLEQVSKLKAPLCKAIVATIPGLAQWVLNTFSPH